MMEFKKLIEATCPDCRGPMSETIHGDDIHEYRCLVGHCYSAHALLVSHYEAQETALWGAVVALEEASNLVRELSPRFPPATQERLASQAETKIEQAKTIRGLLEQLEPFQI